MNKAPAMSAAAGALLWGTIGPTATTLADDELLGAGSGRLLVGALTLCLLAGGKRVLVGWGRLDLRPALMGGLALAGFQVCYFEAVAHAGVATSTAVSIGLAPLVAGLISALRARALPGAGLLIGMVLAIAGVMLVTFGDGSSIRMNPAGLAFAVVAAVLFALQSIAIEVLTSRHTGPRAVAALFTVGALALLPIAAFTAPSSLFAVDRLVVVVYIGAIGGGLAYWLYARGVRRLGASAAVTVSLLEPAGAAVIAMVVLGESLTPFQLAGVVVVCAATVAIARLVPSADPGIRDGRRGRLDDLPVDSCETNCGHLGYDDERRVETIR